MHITIEYCVVWNYGPRATGLVAELKETIPYAQFSLQKSSGGAFEVTVDGALIFSKKAIGRHAKPGEVTALLKRHLGDKQW